MELATPKYVRDLHEGMRFIHTTLDGKRVEMCVDGLERVGSKRRYFLIWRSGGVQHGQIFVREGNEPI